VRDLENNLHPAILERLGLEPALETLASQIRRPHGLQITLTGMRLPERLPPQIELVLFRATQAALEQAIQQL
jgi:signal transduction histidine kinase